MEKKLWIPFIYFMLSFYCFGAGIMDSFVIYHSWLFVGENEFAAMHQAAGQRIIMLYVLPALICTAFTILMFWHRPKAISRRLVWLALLCLILIWLSSAFIQIPIQFQLDNGKDDLLLTKLITTDWIRVVAWFVYTIIVIKMILLISTKYTNKEPRKKIFENADSENLFMQIF